MRIKFPKNQQRKFLQEVLEKTGIPSLRSLRQRGVDVNYSTLKNYFNEDRTLPENFVKELCELSGMKFSDLKIKILDENFGQKKGGKKK